MCLPPFLFASFSLYLRAVKNREKKQHINQELEKIREELQKGSGFIQQNRRERENAEVLRTMTKSFNGIYGVMTDLVKARQQKYNLALAVALGTNFDAVVVQNKDVAIKCMKHMREVRKGRMTFIPLEDVQSSPVPQYLRALGGSAHPIMDHCDYDEQFEKAISYALWNTVVVNTLSEARKIAYGRRNR